MSREITVVGLGPGNAHHLSLETLAVLKKAPKVVLRTAVHPSVSELTKEGVQFVSCDNFYETGNSFEEVYQKIVDFLLVESQEVNIVYAVPGSPLVAERTVVLLREQCQDQNVSVKILPSMSFLDLAYVSLGIDPIAGLRIVDASDIKAIDDAGKYPLLVTQVYSKFVASDLKINLMEVLDDETGLYFLRNLGLPDEECRPIKLFELDRQPQIDHLTSVFIPQQMESSTQCELSGTEAYYNDDGYDIDIMPLVDVIRQLREPGGCPWDREQTSKSIRQNMIEEVYELLEAIDADDKDGIREELGDVLMQVVFHAQVAEETGLFSMQDIVDEVTEKLIRRHPHVFGDIHVDSSSEVMQNWDAIKLEEKKERKNVLDGIPVGLPALIRAYKLNVKAAKVGFDWENREDVWKKVDEELQELQDAVRSGNIKEQEHEMGDVLFALVCYAKHLGIEAEISLNETNNRFVKRFSFVEEKIKNSGKQWNDFSLAEMDVFWGQAKDLEKNN